MKNITLPTALLSLAITSSTQAVTILEYITNLPATGGSNGGIGQLDAAGVDAAFVTNELNFIGTDASGGSQGLGGVTVVNGGLNGTTAFDNPLSAAGAADVGFSINPNGALSGTTQQSLAGGNFIFFTFDAVQDFTLDQISVVSDPNNGNNGNGALTAGAFVSIAGAPATQFGADSFLGTFAPRDNVFTGAQTVLAGQSVTISLAFTDELGGSGNQQATRLGNIRVDATPILPIPEPSSAALMLSGMGVFLLRRRR